MHFEHDVSPSRVVFGAGRCTEVGEELERLGIDCAIVLSSAGQSELGARIAGLIGRRAGVFYPGAVMHTPVEVTDTAMAELARVDVNGIVAVGGGSTIGLSKALAYRTDLPQVVVPTTYAGSEMTPILGQTKNGLKTTLKSEKVVPETVIYDPELTTTLPDFISGPSGMNAIAHAVEALYAKDRSPLIALMAEESIRALGEALPAIMTDMCDIGARERALYGAWLAGACLASVGMAIHHKLCHTLGGSFNLPHADVHCLLIAYSAAYNREAAPEAMQRTARALQAEDAPGALYDLMQQVGRKYSLKQLGMTPSKLERAADLAVQNPYYNPRPVTRDGVIGLLKAAYSGTRP